MDEFDVRSTSMRTERPRRPPTVVPAAVVAAVVALAVIPGIGVAAAAGSGLADGGSPAVGVVGSGTVVEIGADVDAGAGADPGATAVAATDGENVTVVGADLPSSVARNDTVGVPVTVENAGEGPATAAVTLTVDGRREVANRTVALAAGETRTVTLNWTVDAASTGDHGLTAAAGGDGVAGTTTVAGDPVGPTYRVVDLAASDAAGEGSTVDVEATVENEGARNGSQTVELIVDGERAASFGLNLAPGERLTLRYGLDGLAVGDHVVTVATENDTARETATVEPVRNFTITSVAAPDRATSNDTVELRATVENVGGAAGDGTVGFLVDGAAVDTRSLSLAPGENATVSFELPDPEPGSRALVVATANDSAARTVEVVDAADATNLSLRPAATTVEPNETTTVEVVTTPTRGIRSYRLTVDVANDSVASVASVSYPEGAGFTSSNRPDDDGSVTAATIAATIPGADRPRSVLTVELAGDATGETDLSLSVASLNDRDGEPYVVGSVTGATLNVSPDVEPEPEPEPPGVDVGDTGNRSTDTDGDGIHEDVDGDGDFDTADVQALLDDLVAGGVAADNPGLFDVSGDEEVGTGDVQALLDDLV